MRLRWHRVVIPTFASLRNIERLGSAFGRREHRWPGRPRADVEHPRVEHVLPQAPRPTGRIVLPQLSWRRSARLTDTVPLPTPTDDTSSARPSLRRHGRERLHRRSSPFASVDGPTSRCANLALLDPLESESPVRQGPKRSLNPSWIATSQDTSHRMSHLPCDNTGYPRPHFVTSFLSELDTLLLAQRNRLAFSSPFLFDAANFQRTFGLSTCMRSDATRCG